MHVSFKKENKHPELEKTAYYYLKEKNPKPGYKAVMGDVRRIPDSLADCQDTVFISLVCQLKHDLSLTLDSANHVLNTNLSTDLPL